MAKRRKILPNSKVFDGQRYFLNLTFNAKREAVKLAKRLRSEGDKVRVTKEKDLDGKTIYATWLKRG